MASNWDASSILAEIGIVGLVFLVVHLRFRRRGRGSKELPATPVAPTEALGVDAQHRGRGSKEASTMPMAPRSQAALAAWRSERAQGRAFSNGELMQWAGRIVDAHPESFIGEFVEYISDKAVLKRSDRHVHVLNLTELVAGAGRPDIVRGFLEKVDATFGIAVDPIRVHQAMLLAHAVAGDARQVEEALDWEIQASPAAQVSAKSLATVARGYLKAGNLPSARLKLEEMRQSGFEVPPFVFHDWARQAWKKGAARAVSACMDEYAVPLDSDIFASLLEGCARAGDAALAAELERRAAAEGLPTSSAALMAMLKLRARTNDGRAAQTIRTTQETGFTGTPGFWKTIIGHCVESKNIECAEALHAHLLGASAMTPSIYKSLIQVYGRCGKFDQACDLYEELSAAGMDVDAESCASLITCASKSGRTALAQELSDKSTKVGGRVKDYMWLIRSSSKGGDVAEALRVFEQFKLEQPQSVDRVAYNHVIDACACNNDMALAERLAKEMRDVLGVNAVTYNTLIKGYCASRGLAQAMRVLRLFEAEKLAPHAASVRSILGLAARTLSVKEIWDILAAMDRHGVPLDPGSAILLMQAARKAPKPKDGINLLKILDRGDIIIIGDEVIFNVVLDACIHREDKQRIARALHEYSLAKFTPSARTYGLLIRACTALHSVKRCWELWQELNARSYIAMNESLFGCMIEALVGCSHVNAAHALYEEWRHKVDITAATHCTLIRGFAKMDEADKAMALYEEMKASGLKPAGGVYVALIGANCRRGQIQRAEALLEQAQASGVKPKSSTYACLIRGYCLQGIPRAALSLVHTLAEQGYPVDDVIYNAMLDGCVRNRKFKVADELIEFMRERQVPASNGTLMSMLKMWSRRGDLDKAFEALNAALADEAGQPVDAQVGACIVGLCMHHHAPDRALRVFEDMKRWPSFDGPDATTYSSLIGGLAQHGQARQSALIAAEACEALRAGPQEEPRCIDRMALCQMFRALRHERLLQEIGRPLFKELEAAGQRTDSKWLDPA